MARPAKGGRHAIQASLPAIKANKNLALKFIRELVARFGVPNQIITDNGTQFTSSLFSDYYEDMNIKLCFASVAHPRSNGRAERANAEVLKGLKMRTYNELKKHGTVWIEELPAVLWENRTTPSRATGETPFLLVYGAEAVLPFELTLKSPRVRAYNEEAQEDARQQDVQFLEEARCRAALLSARYQQALRRYHQRQVRSREIKASDLVLRRFQSREGMNKLSLMWEGPFRVAEVRRPRAVKLIDAEGFCWHFLAHHQDFTLGDGTRNAWLVNFMQPPLGWCLKQYLLKR